MTTTPTATVSTTCTTSLALSSTSMATAASCFIKNPFPSPSSYSSLSFNRRRSPTAPPPTTTTTTRICCQVALKSSTTTTSSTSQQQEVEDLEAEKIGRRVKVKVPLKVYHIPRVPEVDLTAMEGVIKQYVGVWKGKKISANLPFKVEFQTEIEGRGQVKVFAHLKEDEFDYLD